MAVADGSATVDERVRHIGRFRSLLLRPESTALLGTVLVWMLFAVWAGDRGFLSVAGTANVLEIAAQLGVLGAAVALLMIAGEFDLSMGSMIGASGMVLAITVAEFGWPVWAGVASAFAFALAFGFLNGYLVVKTGLPSFIITLASLFGLRGLTLVMAKAVTGRTVVGGLDKAIPGDIVATIFMGKIQGFSITIVWWVIVAVACHIVLTQTRFGNWIFGTGGSAMSAKNLGVPVGRVKILLFMGTASAACLMACIQVITYGSADANRGTLKEFEAIITAVVGGTLLTGGFGSVVGTVFGALTLGITQQGLFYAAIDYEWYKVLLAIILLGAVLINQWARRRAEAHT